MVNKSLTQRGARALVFREEMHAHTRTIEEEELKINKQAKIKNKHLWLEEVNKNL